LVVRPRQARYQAALRPDMKCFLHSKTLSNFTPSQCNYFQLDCQDCVECYNRMASIRAYSGISSACRRELCSQLANEWRDARSQLST
jgi:hypothetical protein